MDEVEAAAAVDASEKQRQRWTHRLAAAVQPAVEATVQATCLYYENMSTAMNTTRSSVIISNAETKFASHYMSFVRRIGIAAASRLFLASS